MKRFWIQILIGLFVAFLMGTVYIFVPTAYQSIDDRLRDYLFIVRGPIQTTDNVTIVDLDEKSLRELGQWPWQRYKVAQLLQRLTEAGAGVIGFDIVFAERDNSSPAKVLDEIGLHVAEGEEIPDYDAIFAQTVTSTPTILGYIFAMGDDHIEPSSGPMIPAIFIEKGKGDKEYLLQPWRPILNIPIVQNNAYSSGFFNNIPSEDGIVRSVPLVMKYDMVVYPSLAMEMIRVLHNANRVYVNYSEGTGVESVQVGETLIPTDRHGRLMVNYRGPGRTFPYISAVDIYNGDFDPKLVEGKFILIGTSAAGLLDLRAMPFDNVYPGVEAHANVIDNILSGDFITRPAWIPAADLLIFIVISMGLATALAFASAGVSLVLALVSLSAGMFFNYYMLFEQGLTFNILFMLLSIVVVFLLSTIANYFLETRQKEMIKGKFASKVSPAVMEDILRNPDPNVLAGTDREITVFFSDVRNFTNISEAIGSAKNLITFLNEYMDPMTEIIIKEQGTVDKFIGDAIMAYWNAPHDVPDHPDRAVVATMEQLHALDGINEKIRQDPRFENVVKMSDEKGVPPIDIGIGLNTGMAIVGEMGSKGRSDYTVIGDPVNLGSRMESLCKFYNSKCNVTNFTKERLKGKYIYRFLDLVTVKGKKEPVEVWQIHDYDRDESLHKLYTVSRARLDEELARYHHAIELYKAAKFTEALEIFKEMEEWPDKTNKNIYKIYIERCEHYIAEPPEHFTGVFVHTTKG